MCDDGFSSKTLVNHAVVRKRRGALQESSVVANFVRPCLPGRTSRLAATCVHVMLLRSLQSSWNYPRGFAPVAWT